MGYNISAGNGTYTWLVNQEYWVYVWNNSYRTSYAGAVYGENKYTEFQSGTENTYGLRPLIRVSKDILNSYAVNVSNTANGTIDISNLNNEIKITATPSEGYEVDSISAKAGEHEYTISKNQDKTYKFTFDKTYGDVTVSATFKKKQFTITTTATEGGNIMPTNPITVEYGENQELTITADEGYKIKSVKVDNVDKTLNLVDGKLTLSNVKANARVEVKFVAEGYEFIEGKNAKYDNADMQFKLNGLYNLFDKLYVNGTELSKDNYTVKEGSTIITLKNEYLSTLAVGAYTLKATYTNGTSDETTFVVEEKKITDNEENKDSITDTTPKTGDNIVFYLGTLVLAILGTAVVLIKKNKVSKTRSIKK